jgi:uncharacterized protein
MAESSSVSVLADRIDVDLAVARRQRDEVGLRTLSLLKSELVRAGKEPGAGQLSEEAELSVVRRELKRRQEAAEAFSAAGRSSSALQEQASVDLLRRYLPVQISDAELERELREVISQVGARSPRDLGSVMKAATPRLSGRAEPGRIAGAAKRLLGA